MRICLLIRGLNFGGAQRQLVALANGLVKSNHKVSVVVLYPENPLGSQLDERVEFLVMNKRNRWDLAIFFIKLINIIGKMNPDIIYSFMEVSNILSICLKLFIPKLKVIWGIRHSFLNLKEYDWATTASEIAERKLACYVDQIIFNSYAGINIAKTKGFPTSKSCVIHNGIDTDIYRPDNQSRVNLRQEWSISYDERAIGIVGRLNPMKDHHTFLKAASRLKNLNSKVRFVCIGDGPLDYKNELKNLSHDLSLDDKVIWIGNRLDMPSVYNSLDILVSSSSFGEGFPNVIGEAMACGVPCIVTDVGESAIIVGDESCVVPPESPDSLAQAMNDLLTQFQDIDKVRIRQRIVERFSIESMVDATEEILISVLKHN